MIAACWSRPRIRPLCRDPSRSLCPAGHLPHEGGDRPSSMISPTTNLAKRALPAKLPISPLWAYALR
ncbi:MAG: hypothetical protein E5Y56_30735 [Mesorhizobium sp.]|nr:MAG: hypothetical protein E5Y56_30735 [Mesorhizobium sp.]